MVKYEKYKTKAGKEFWRYSAYDGIDEKTGKKNQLRARGFTTRTAAKVAFDRALEELRSQVKKGNNKRLTFLELFEEFLVYYKATGITPGTYKKFKDESERHILPILGTIYIDRIDINDCQKIYETIKKTRKDHNKIVNQAERILDFAISKTYLTVNPMKNILKNQTKVRYSKKRLDRSENFYSPTQLLDFLEAYREVEEYHKFAYFRLLAFSGLRRGEALALYESDFLRKERAISVSKTLAEDTEGKTYLKFYPKTESSDGLVYLDLDTFNVLEELIKNRNSYDYYGKVVHIHTSKYLFPSPKTGQYYSRAMPNEWLRMFFQRNESALKERGLHRISPHGFRHSQATLLFELGVDPKDAQHRLRHKNLKTTSDIYTHITESRKRLPITKLDSFSAEGATLGATPPDSIQKRS